MGQSKDTTINKKEKHFSNCLLDHRAGQAEEMASGYLCRLCRITQPLP